MGTKAKTALFRSDALAAALDGAVTGNRLPLFDLLCRASWLPGKTANLPLAWAFAEECVARGPKTDALALAMASLDADEAPGATELEFLPMCGVATFAVRAIADTKGRTRHLRHLHDCADDLRWRVRELVVLGLARAGEAIGPPLLDEVEGWMDGYFHAAAVLLAIGQPGFLAALPQAAPVIAKLDEAFLLAKRAERAASRYPGFKALVEALSTIPGIAGARFGVPVFDMLIRWSDVKDPALRAVVERNVDKAGGRFAEETARVRRALVATTPAHRDPSTYVGRTRGRGKKNKRG